MLSVGWPGAVVFGTMLSSGQRWCDQGGSHNPNSSAWRSLWLPGGFGVGLLRAKQHVGGDWLGSFWVRCIVETHML